MVLEISVHVCLAIWVCERTFVPPFELSLLFLSTFVRLSSRSIPQWLLSLNHSLFLWLSLILTPSISPIHPGVEISKCIRNKFRQNQRPNSVKEVKTGSEWHMPRGRNSVRRGQKQRSEGAGPHFRPYWALYLCVCVRAHLCLCVLNMKFHNGSPFLIWKPLFCTPLFLLFLFSPPSLSSPNSFMDSLTGAGL